MKSIWIGLLCVVVGLPRVRIAAQSMPAGQLSAQHVSQATNPTPASVLLGSTTNIGAGSPNAKSRLTVLALDGAKPATCSKDDSGKFYYRVWFPLLSSNCVAVVANQAAGAPILNYFNVASTAAVANQTQYLYNAKQSTNQVNADLFTATFPGFQAVLAGTATAGSSQPAAAAAGGSSAPPATTDSVATAVSKLESGGDFNLRFPVPVARSNASSSTFDVKFIPNIGFTVNGLTAQSTVTESTQYSIRGVLRSQFV